jgi:hypothetical protein
MSVKKSNYSNMDWVLALKARKEPIDYEAQLASSEECTENVVERTVQAAFSLPTKEETSEEALKRASKTIHDDAAVSAEQAAADGIRQKLASRSIDPVALGVAKAEDWNGSTDLQWLEKTAKNAAIAFQKKLSESWQDGATERTSTRMQNYNPETFRDGRIMSTAAAGEDAHGFVSKTPANSNSIFDPFKLDRFAKEDTEHDKRVAARKAEEQARAQKVASDKAKAVNTIPEGQEMHGAKVVASGSATPGVFSPRSPRDQISMTDDLTKKISELFTRVDDNKSKTLASKQERLEKIQGKKEADDRSWEKLSKPTSTAGKMADLQERLKDLWTTNE